MKEIITCCKFCGSSILLSEFPTVWNVSINEEGKPFLDSVSDNIIYNIKTIYCGRCGLEYDKNMNYKDKGKGFYYFLMDLKDDDFCFLLDQLEFYSEDGDAETFSGNDVFDYISQLNFEYNQKIINKEQVALALDQELSFLYKLSKKILFN